MKPSLKLPIKNLTEEPYASILCYPQTKAFEVDNRILELKELRVEAIEFTGGGLAYHLPVIGKGHVGIVVLAHKNGERLALKMRRLDGSRENFFHEAEMLQKANTLEVGPKFEEVSKNFLLTQFIDGDFLAKYLENHKKPEVYQRVIRDILEQCWRLDEAWLDHGELSDASKHLLLNKGGKPFIIDFETASIGRKVSNVTSVCQHLFFGYNPVQKLIWETLEEKNKDKIVDSLRNYKKERSRKNFEILLQTIL